MRHPQLDRSLKKEQEKMPFFSASCNLRQFFVS